MTNAYELRKHFFLEDYNTAITREDFEAFFTKTKERPIRAVSRYPKIRKGLFFMP